MRRGFLAAIGVALVASCAAFGGGDESGVGTQTTDAGDEKNVSDAGGATDTRPEPVNDAAGPTGCAAVEMDPKLSFCDDFESETDPRAFWAGGGAGDAPTIFDDQGNHVLRVVATGPNATSTLSRTLDLDVKNEVAVVDADVRFVSGQYNSATLLDVSAAGLGTFVFCGLTAYGTTFVPAHNAPAKTNVPAKLGEWHHVTLTFGTKEDAGRQTLLVDSTLIYDDTLNAAGTSNQLYLHAGIYESTADPSPGLTLDFDNVIVRRQ